MNLFRPTSVPQLLLIAFSVVGLPLGIALVVATVSADRLAKQSQLSVLDAARIAESSRILTEEVLAMERNARQYELLGDSKLFELYLRQRARFAEAVRALRKLDLSDLQSTLLDQLTTEEQRIFRGISAARDSPGHAQLAIQRFPHLYDIASTILFESRATIGEAIHLVEQEAKRLRARLLTLASVVIPSVFCLAIIGTIIITRAIRQLDSAIHHLGEGEFSSPIEVKGLQDLEDLGKRLDWLRERLLESDEQKAKFLQHVSHELKTPLTAIREGAQLLNDEVVGKLNDEQQEITGILRLNSIELQKHIEDLLSFSAISKHALTIKTGNVRLDHIAANVINDQRMSLQAKQIVVQSVLAPSVVRGDPDKLRVVIENLVSNAIKYSRPQGEIQIRVQHDTSEATFDIRDNGPGIKPEERSRIFEPFYQGSARAGGHVKGTGLGLSIAREYVKAHAGEIEIVAADVGTHMRVTLPLAGIGRPETAEYS